MRNFESPIKRPENPAERLTRDLDRREKMERIRRRALGPSDEHFRVDDREERFEPLFDEENKSERESMIGDIFKEEKEESARIERKRELDRSISSRRIAELKNKVSSRSELELELEKRSMVWKRLVVVVGELRGRKIGLFAKIKFNGTPGERPSDTLEGLEMTNQNQAEAYFEKKNDKEGLELLRQYDKLMAQMESFISEDIQKRVLVKHENMRKSSKGISEGYENFAHKRQERIEQEKQETDVAHNTIEKSLLSAGYKISSELIKDLKISEFLDELEKHGNDPLRAAVNAELKIREELEEKGIMFKPDGTVALRSKEKAKREYKYQYLQTLTKLEDQLLSQYRHGESYESSRRQKGATPPIRQSRQFPRSSYDNYQNERF